MAGFNYHYNDVTDAADLASLEGKMKAFSAHCRLQVSDPRDYIPVNVYATDSPTRVRVAPYYDTDTLYGIVISSMGSDGNIASVSTQVESNRSIVTLDTNIFEIMYVKG